jgi:hypothetical protein
MITQTETLPGNRTSSGNNGNGNGFHFEAADVTGTHLVDARDVQRSTPAGAVAQAMAARMGLPQNVPWALRDDRSGNYLDEQRAIGDQVESDEARLTVVPKTHLGAH